MIGIIAAMNEEVKELENLMEDSIEETISNTKFVSGILANKKIVLMKSGVGKGNAAMTTTILLEHFHIEQVINIGTAGGLKTNQDILDIVISDKIVQHDYDTSGLDGDEGIGLYYQSDEHLSSVCNTILCNLKKRFHIGLIASGDQFICNDSQLARLMSTFPDAICAEMEAGGIAQVCSSYQIPFIVLRSLSDIAHKEGSHMDFEEYVHQASKASAQICKEIVLYI